MTIRPATLWVYAAESEGSVEQIESMASLLADKVQVPHSEIKEAQRRVQTHAWINGSVALAMTQDIARKVHALVSDSGVIVMTLAEAEIMYLDEAVGAPGAH